MRERIRRFREGFKNPKQVAIFTVVVITIGVSYLLSLKNPIVYHLNLKGIVAPSSDAYQTPLNNSVLFDLSLKTESGEVYFIKSYDLNELRGHLRLDLRDDIEFKNLKCPYFKFHGFVVSEGQKIIILNNDLPIKWVSCK